jgi:hypothetical protein
MKKRGIILIIILLVVVNISTYCGYGRMNRAIDNKKPIETSQVDSTRILRIPKKGETVKYQWRKLNQDQIGEFISTWDKFHGAIPFKMEPTCEIKVYYKGKVTRTFWTFQNNIREGRLHYYCYNLSVDYFENLYQNAGSK